MCDDGVTKIVQQWALVNVLTTCQLKKVRCQEYFKNGSLVETCFTLFNNIVGHSTWRYYWCHEYSTNDHPIEKCFQLHINVINELI